MTRRRFYAPPAAFSRNNRFVLLSEEETRHTRDVLRLRSGDEVYVFDGEGKEFRCLVREFVRDGTVLNLQREVEPARPESPLKLTMAVALLKGDKFDLVVQKATELGVSRVVPVATARADVQIRNAGEAARKVTRWKRIALEAAKQSGRALLMEIAPPVGFESLMSGSKHHGELRLMFAEREGTSFAELAASLPSSPGEVIALVGSEGGWTDDELTRARAIGWEIVTLGGRTVRAETATIVIATLLQNRFGDLV